MKVYNKLIRDKIPEIIEASGKHCDVVVLAPDAYLTHLNQKLGEELQEYQETGDVAELADLVEVVYAVLNQKGISIQDFEALRLAKRAERGGFDKRLLLVSVIEPS